MAKSDSHAFDVTEFAISANPQFHAYRDSDHYRSLPDLCFRLNVRVIRKHSGI